MVAVHIREAAKKSNAAVGYPSPVAGRVTELGERERA
jgi:hypothetical protein